MKIGDVVYFRVNGENFIQKRILIGETSRSWLMAPNGIKGDVPTYILQRARRYGARFLKKSFVPVTEREYHLQKWAADNRWPIESAIRWTTDLEMLVKVARLLKFENLP